MALERYNGLMELIMMVVGSLDKLLERENFNILMVISMKAITKITKLMVKVLTQKNQEFFFSGSWLNDLQHGYGEETWADGSKYCGLYVDGKKSGYGTYLWSD